MDEVRKLGFVSAQKVGVHNLLRLGHAAPFIEKIEYFRHHRFTLVDDVNFRFGAIQMSWNVVEHFLFIWCLEQYEMQAHVRFVRNDFGVATQHVDEICRHSTQKLFACNGLDAVGSYVNRLFRRGHEVDP